MLYLVRARVGPVLGAFSQRDKVGHRQRRLLLVELAGYAAHGGIHHDGGAVGNNRHGDVGSGRIRKIRRSRRGLLASCVEWRCSQTRQHKRGDEV